MFKNNDTLNELVNYLKEEDDDDSRSIADFIVNEVRKFM